MIALRRYTKIIKKNHLPKDHIIQVTAAIKVSANIAPPKKKTIITTLANINKTIISILLQPPYDTVLAKLALFLITLAIPHSQPLNLNPNNKITKIATKN